MDGYHFELCLDMDGRYRQSIAGDSVLGEETC